MKLFIRQSKKNTKNVIILFWIYVRLGVSKVAYYKWLNRKPSENEQKNKLIAELVEKIHDRSPNKGYRKIKDEIAVSDIDVNDKRICRNPSIKSTIKYSKNGYTTGS